MMDKNLFARLSDKSDYNSRTNEKEILNPYVNFLDHSNSQTLANVLVAESIQMRGVKLYYLPRQYYKPDLILGEDNRNFFDLTYQFAGYIVNNEGYGGSIMDGGYGEMFNDEITININPDLFKHQTNDTEPFRGDLIYFPMDNSLFEITFVQPYDPFYQVGQNVTRTIIAQKFVYSGEEISPVMDNKDVFKVNEFSLLDLEPLKSLDGLSDTNENEYAESVVYDEEGKDFIKPHVVNNGRGKEQKSYIKNDFPFDTSF